MLVRVESQVQALLRRRLRLTISALCGAARSPRATRPGSRASRRFQRHTPLRDQVPEHELERHARRRNVQVRGRLVQAGGRRCRLDELRVDVEMRQRIGVVGPRALPGVLPAQQPHMVSGLESIGVRHGLAVIPDHLDRLLDEQPLADAVKRERCALLVLKAGEVVLRVAPRDRQQRETPVGDRPVENGVQIVGEALGDSTRRLDDRSGRAIAGRRAR
jgi:hypothetical protein